MRRALPYIYPGLQVVSGLMGQKKLSFGKAMVNKIEFWQIKFEFLAKYTSSRIND